MVINNFSNFLDLAFNPYSKRYKSYKHFVNKLDGMEKVKVVAGTLFAIIFSCGLAGLGTFRYLVSFYKEKKVKPPFSTTPLDAFIQSIFNKSIFEADYKEIKFYSKDEVQDLLDSVFGKTATLSAMCMYRLLPAKKISSIALHTLLIGIVSNLTKKDINFIEKNYHGTCLSPMISAITAQIPEGAERKIEILNKLRRIAPLPHNPVVKQEILRIGCKDQLHKDKKLLGSVHWIDNMNISPDKGTHELKKFSYAEYLAHVIIYALESKGNFAAFQTGTLIPVRTYNDPACEGKTMLMEAHRLITKNGLHSVVLVPSEINSFSKEQTVPIQILFRGSKDAGAWNRNLNLLEKQQAYGWEGPGGASFNKNKYDILKNLQKILLLTPVGQPIKFEIFGHSLGASDAQRMCALLAESMVSKQSSVQKENSEIEKSTLFNRIVEEVNLFCFNAPGVEEILNERFLKNLETLKKVKFQLRYFKVAHDPIQTAANQLLGYYSKLKAPIENLFVSIFKLAKPLENFFFTLKNAHSNKFLCNFSNLKKRITNNAWIEYVKTNNPEDSNIHQRGPRGDENPTLGKYKHSSAFSALDNRGSWSRSLRSFFGIPKHNHQIAAEFESAKTKAFGQLADNYRVVSQKISLKKEIIINDANAANSEPVV